MRRDYYVYLWKDRLGNVVYVGKGTGRRAYTPRKGLHPKNFTVVIVQEGLTHQEALELERQVQADYRVGRDDPGQEDWREELDSRSAREWFDDAFDEDEISSLDDLEDCVF